MAICDAEEQYIRQITQFLQNKSIFNYTLHGFTDICSYNMFEKDKKIDILLMAESMYRSSTGNFDATQILILNESGQMAGEGIININKYQSSENIFREILNSGMELTEHYSNKLGLGNHMKIIGNYSPIRRCLQTTYALCMGQLLSKKHKTLYLNFESFSGFSNLLQREFSADITDVLYYFDCEKQKLPYRLEGIVQNINGLDFIPPVMSYSEMEAVTAKQWLLLFEEIDLVTDYEYLILDLSEQMQGLFDILRECIRVYTITKEDGIASAKIRQYEELLEKMEYKDVVEKTKKCNLPLFRKLPFGLEQLTHGELAEYVKAIIEEDLYEQKG